ncbi:GntR family transcriptional regulator [Paenibacillus yanchengensis]|uniref:GntR family transcriptional regulator n=1 Tax=Paenibacillus yanchengensis TaxID=2035833 RepID=A0ABW4YNH8_9BACL
MQIIIYKNKNIPIYEQITQQIKDAILTGTLRPGDPILSIRVLAKQLGVSVITVQRAYDELTKAGLIETLLAKGSYITEDCNTHLQAELYDQLQSSIDKVIHLANTLQLTKQQVVDLFQTQMNDVE